MKCFKIVFFNLSLIIQLFSLCSASQTSFKEGVQEEHSSSATCFVTLNKDSLNQIFNISEINAILAVRASTFKLKEYTENKSIWAEKLDYIFQKYCVKEEFQQLINDCLKKDNTKPFILKMGGIQKVLALWQSLNEKNLFKEINDFLRAQWFDHFLKFAVHGNSQLRYPYSVIRIAPDPFILIRYNPFLTACNFIECQFTNTHMQALIPALKTIKHLKSISFFKSKIGNIGIRYINDLLEGHQTLEELNIIETDITDEGAVYLAEGLNKNNILKELKIGKNDIYDQGLITLKELEKQKQPRLKIKWDGDVIIASHQNNDPHNIHPGDIMLKEWLENPSDHLSVLSGFISTPKIKKLISILKNHSQLSSISINNNFDFSHAEEIIQAICHNSNLTYLHLTKFPFSSRTFKTLMTQCRFTSLYSLSLHDNNINSEYIASLMQVCTNLKELALTSCLDRESAWYLGRILKSHTTLESLDLSYNNLSAQEVDKILQYNTCLRSLNISNNNLGSFTPILTLLQGLERLQLNEVGLAALPKSINKLTNLKHLEIANNNLSTLPENFSTLTKLYFLDIKKNSISHLFTFIEKLPNLQLLVFHQNRFVRVPEIHSCLSKLDLL